MYRSKWSTPIMCRDPPQRHTITIVLVSRTGPPKSLAGSIPVSLESAYKVRKSGIIHPMAMEAALYGKRWLTSIFRPNEDQSDSAISLNRAIPRGPASLYF